MDEPEAPEPDRSNVERRSREILHGGEEGHASAAAAEESAALTARRTLEESEERTFDPATTDPRDPGVIRRDSEEVASSGD